MEKFNDKILEELRTLERGSTSVINANLIILTLFSNMMRSSTNDKRGFNVTNQKVVKYAYVDFKSGSVERANGICVGNYLSGDFELTI